MEFVRPRVISQVKKMCRLAIHPVENYRTMYITFLAASEKGKGSCRILGTMQANIKEAENWLTK
jgi:hypothetical protein